MGGHFWRPHTILDTCGFKQHHSTSSTRFTYSLAIKSTQCSVTRARTEQFPPRGAVLAGKVLADLPCSWQVFAYDEVTNSCLGCVNYVCPLALWERREVLTAAVWKIAVCLLTLVHTAVFLCSFTCPSSPGLIISCGCRSLWSGYIGFNIQIEITVLRRMGEHTCTPVSFCLLSRSEFAVLPCY